MDAFWAAPPVSRTLVGLTAIQSLLVHGHLMSSYWVVFYYPWIAKFPPQLWRLFTPFLLTGGSLNFFFDLYFLWTYSTDLEKNSPRFSQPGDYFTFLVFVGTFILITAGFILEAAVFLSPLVLAIIYIYAQDNRGKKVHFIIIQVPAEYLPWLTMALALILGGPNHAIKEGTGLIAGHLYDFLTRLYPTFQGGRNYIQTPQFIRQAFGSGTAAWNHRTYGSAFRPGEQRQPTTGSSSGWTSAFGGNWRGRGAGRRLGGD